MAKEDLVEGLRLAVEKGSTLREAMMSFFNAGYKREDIEDAARDMQAPQFAQLTQAPGTKAQKPGVAKPGATKKLPSGQPSQTYYTPTTVTTTQKVSSYEAPSRIPLVTLIIILFVLLGALVALFIFRNQFTSLLNNLIG